MKTETTTKVKNYLENGAIDLLHFYIYCVNRELKVKCLRLLAGIKIGVLSNSEGNIKLKQRRESQGEIHLWI